MSFEIIVLLSTFIISIILGIIIIPILKKLKVGQIERNDGPASHLKKQGTPTMGGIIMIIVILCVGAFLCIDYIKDEQQNVATALVPLLAVTVGFGIIGLIFL